MSSEAGGAVWDIDTFPLNIRISNALVSWIGYVIKMFYPADLVILYPHPGNTLALWQPVVSLGVLIAISVIVIVLSRKNLFLLIGWLWYLGTLLPVIGLVQVGSQAMADRYTYLPLIGLFIMVAWGADRLSAKWSCLKIVWPIASGVILISLLICTRIQVSRWRDSETLFKHTLAVTKNNPIIHNNIGMAFLKQKKLPDAVKHFQQAIRINPKFAEGHYNMARVMQYEDKLDEAVNYYKQTLKIKPDYASAHNNLGTVLQLQGKLNEAIEQYQQVVMIKPNYAEAYYNLAMALQLQGKLDDAVKYYQKTIQLKPKHPKALNNLGMAYQSKDNFNKAAQYYQKALKIAPDLDKANYNIGELLRLNGNFNRAIDFFTVALRSSPDYLDAHFKLALALDALGQRDKAIQHLNKALRLKPDWDKAHNSLGNVYYYQGRFDMAVVHWTKTVDLAPDSTEALNNLAWILAASKDPKLYNPSEAIVFSKRACELTNYQQPRMLDTLAVAYAATGDFNKAVETAREAISMAQADENKEFAKEIQKRLELYKTNQPYLEPVPK